MAPVIGYIILYDIVIRLRCLNFIDALRAKFVLHFALTYIESKRLNLQVLSIILFNKALHVMTAKANV